MQRVDLCGRSVRLIVAVLAALALLTASFGVFDAERGRSGQAFCPRCAERVAGEPPGAPPSPRSAHARSRDDVPLSFERVHRSIPRSVRLRDAPANS